MTTSTAPAKAPRPPAPVPPAATRGSKAKAWATRAPLLPALVFLVVVTQLPFVATLVLSLFDWKIGRAHV